MEADHPARRLRARGIAALSGNVFAPRGRRIPAALKAVHPAREQKWPDGHAVKRYASRQAPQRRA
eukprot:1160311-Prymnesium_polylepis.1